MQERDKKNKVPNSVKVLLEARRKAEESMKAAMQPSQRIAEVMKQNHSSIENLRKSACPTSYVAEMMRGIKQQQKQVHADMIRHLENIAIPDYTSEIRQMMSQLKFSNPMVEALKQYRQAFDSTNIFKSTIVEQWKLDKKIIEALKPTFQVQNSIALELFRNNWQDALRSIKDSLKDFRPSVEVLRDALVIDKEQFSQEQISQISNDYLLDANSEKYVFRKNNKKNFWTSIPKRVVWVLLVIIILYVQAGWRGLVKSGPLDLERFEKLVTSGRKNIVKHFSEWFTVRPFVSTEKLKVYLNPKRKSIKIAELEFLQEVKVLKFKKKKRWALIEWEDESGETCQGWALTRYIYRKNIKER